MIQAYTPINIQYTKDTGEVSTRTIIPTTEVPQNIRAVDISKLDESEQIRLIDLFAEYQKYVKSHLATMFSFQDWAEHSLGERFDELLWRTFKCDNIKVL